MHWHICESAHAGQQEQQHAWLLRSWAALWRMRLNMLRKPLFLEGVRLCCRPMSVIQSGVRLATCCASQPLRPCTSSAASPCT